MQKLQDLSLNRNACRNPKRSPIFYILCNASNVGGQNQLVLQALQPQENKVFSKW